MTIIKLSKIAMIGVLCSSSFAFAVAVEECEGIVHSKDPAVTNTSDFFECKTLKKLSGNAKVEAVSIKDQKDRILTSMNKKVQCVQKASYTYDYASCEHAINVYNYVLLAENAMNLQQQTRAEFNNQKLQAQAQESAAKGDLQVGALDVNEKAQKFSANLYKERVGAFSVAVTALVTAAGKIANDSDVKKLCGDAKDGLEPAKCLSYYSSHKNSVLANSQAKDALKLEAARYSAEVLRSVGEMNKSLANAKATEQMKNNYNDISDNQNNLEHCFYNPTDPKCITNRGRTAIDSVAGAGVNFGGEGSSNAFDFNAAGNESLDEEFESTHDGQVVASMGSPFSEEARAAQGFLDPAAAANVEFGGGGVNGGGGGGGSGGGGLGGGSGAPAEEGEQVAKTSITGGDVAMEDGSTKGKGFSAISKGKEAAANPFASLFDGKGAGGIEEDRSIASGDISGQASGLFQKISKRYGQVQADKRVETNNLE